MNRGEHNITDELTFTMAMFFTTPAELSPAAKKSWKLFKNSFVRSQQRSDSEIDYMRYGSSIAEYGGLTLLSGIAYRWTTDGHRSI